MHKKKKKGLSQYSLAVAGHGFQGQEDKDHSDNWNNALETVCL